MLRLRIEALPMDAVLYTSAITVYPERNASKGIEPSPAVIAKTVRLFALASTGAHPLEDRNASGCAGHGP